MAEENTSLEAFFESKEEKTEASKDSSISIEQEISDINLENEFAKLLENFINGDEKPSSSEQNLDSFITPTTNTSQNKEEISSIPSLDSFVSTSSADNKDLDEVFASSKENKENILSDTKPLETTTIPENKTKLKQEEQELATAFFNFREGILAIAGKKNLKTPTLDYNDEQLYPNYKPSIGRKIAQYLLSSWDILTRYDPENMKKLNPKATDEEYLVFAEQLDDTDMQLVIISYVEILINLEICETKYEQMKEIAVQKRIKKELYEEYMKLQERKALFIKKLKEQNFPINVDALINNYFKASQKDSKGAYNALTKNPAMFSPIQMDKLKPKFFGLIKVTPEDGIKINQKIGAFIKKLKI